MSLADRDRIRELERRAAETATQLARLPVREAKSRVAGGGTIIFGTVDSAVGIGDATITLNDYRVIFGRETRDAGDLVVHNVYSEAFDPGDTLSLVMRDNGATKGQYEPDRASAGTGSSVIRYELVQDMLLADTAKLAKPVTAAGALDSGASSFYVVDQDHQFCGLAAYTDSLGTQAGYRGFAVKYTDDYNSTGVPGYRIDSQQGPMRFIVVTLTEDSQSPLATECQAADADEMDKYGNPFSGRYPVSTSAAGAFDVADPFLVANEAVEDDTWLVIYNEDANQYEFLFDLKQTVYHRIRGKLYSGTVTSSSTSLTLDNVEAVSGKSPVSGTADQITVAIPPNATMAISASYTGYIYAQYNEQVGTDKTDRWDSGDAANHWFIMCGHPNFDNTKFQLLVNDGTGVSDMQWMTLVDVLKTLTGWSATDDQSIGHDDSDDPEWQDDGTC